MATPDKTLLLMLDDVDISIEARYTGSAAAIAGYVNGRFENWPAVVQKWGNSGKHLVSIDVQNYPAAGAQCLDIENGDAKVSEAPAWFRATKALGVQTGDLRYYPKLYISASGSASLIKTMTAAGIPRSEYMLWSAHYTNTAHICGPGTCGYPQADATQYTNKDNGANLDASQCYAYFFAGKDGVVPTAPPAVNPAEPTLQIGDTGPVVTALQKKLAAIELVGVRGIKADGDFGVQTQTSVRNFQSHQRLEIDGIVGPTTWAAIDAWKNAPTPPPPPVPVKVNAWAALTVLKQGSTGAAVEVLQRMCRDSGVHGVRGIAVDGNFGEQTLAAVRNFQAYAKLTVDGIAGPATHKALEAISPLDDAEIVPVPAEPDPEPLPPAPAPAVDPAPPTPPAPAPEAEPAIDLMDLGYDVKFIHVPAGFGLPEGSYLPIFVPKEK